VILHHRRKSSSWLLVFSLPAALLLSGVAQAATYYVSPNGNDANSGLDAGSPWQTLSKVNSTTFEPGSEILFQRGGEWRERLVASSSGAAGQPIIYDAYGSGAKPRFWGSDVLNKPDFQPVAGSSSTFSLSTASPINSVLIDHRFSRSAQLLTNSVDSLTNINFVKANPNSWFHDGSRLYLNTGGINPSSDARTYTASVREDVVHSNAKDHLVFRNLIGDETARYNGGYAFRIEGSNNVQIEASEAYRAGKHHFGVINSTNFVGRNLHASEAMPDQGYGGASPYVSFSDHRRSGDTSAWIDIVAESSYWGYAGFVTHGTGMGEVLVKNMIIRGGAGMHVQTEGVNEKVRIEGGQVDNGPVLIGSNVTIDGLTITGMLGAIDITGDNNVIQNSRIVGRLPNYLEGRKAAITDGGHNNTIRYNTISLADDFSGYGAAIGILNADGDTEIYGNAFTDPHSILLYGGNAPIDSHGNLYAPESLFGIFRDLDHLDYYHLAQWQAMGFDLNSVFGTVSPDAPPGYFGETGIPEPSSAVLALAGSVLLSLRRRSRYIPSASQEPVYGQRALPRASGNLHHAENPRR
jgi:hypothetical protein